MYKLSQKRTSVCRPAGRTVGRGGACSAAFGLRRAAEEPERTRRLRRARLKPGPPRPDPPGAADSSENGRGGPQVTPGVLRPGPRGAEGEPRAGAERGTFGTGPAGRPEGAVGPRSGRARRGRAAGRGLLSGPRHPKPGPGRDPSECPEEGDGPAQPLRAPGPGSQLPSPHSALCAREPGPVAAGACPRVVGESRKRRGTPAGERRGRRRRRL